MMSTAVLGKGHGDPEDFCRERADRIGWLPQVLREPDAIYRHFADSHRYLYITRTLFDEEFIVVVAESFNPRGTGWFVTFYNAGSADWAKERIRYRKTHPVKAAKKKGR